MLIAAGGSGGHLIPAQQLARLLMQNYSCEVHFAGYHLCSSPYFTRESFGFDEITSAPLSHPIAFLGAIWNGTRQAMKVLRRYNPSVVVGFGSYHTVPILLAAVLLRKKIVLYEANRIMGKVNRLFAPFAKAITIQLPQTKSQSKLIQVPLFPWILERVKTQAEARSCYQLRPDISTVLIFGGSQGAHFLNEIAPLALKNKDLQAIHLAGNKAAANQVKQLYDYLGIAAIVKDFEPNMTDAYAAADFAICRSGAGTIAELLRYEIPALMIPYPHGAEDHQTRNAEFVQAKGCGICIQQKQTSAEILSVLIDECDWKRMKLAFRSQKEQDKAVAFDAVVAQMGGFA